MRYKKDIDEAKIALNSGFVKIVQYLESYKMENSFEGWCKRIMVNCLIDEYRKDKKRKERFAYVNGFETLGDKEGFVLNRAEEELDADGVRDLLKLLPELTERVFIYLLLMDISIEKLQIAGYE